MLIEDFKSVTIVVFGKDGSMAMWGLSCARTLVTDSSLWSFSYRPGSKRIGDNDGEAAN